jgi:hypothetical protein
MRAARAARQGAHECCLGGGGSVECAAFQRCTFQVRPTTTTGLTQLFAGDDSRQRTHWCPEMCSPVARSVTDIDHLTLGHVAGQVPAVAIGVQPAATGKRRTRVDGTDQKKVPECLLHRLAFRSIQEVKIKDINVERCRQTLELQHGAKQGHALDLGRRRVWHVIVEEALRVQPEALARRCATRSARPLRRLHSADGPHCQPLHACSDRLQVHMCCCLLGATSGKQAQKMAALDQLSTSARLYHAGTAIMCSHPLHMAVQEFCRRAADRRLPWDHASPATVLQHCLLHCCAMCSYEMRLLTV